MGARKRRRREDAHRAPAPGLLDSFLRRCPDCGGDRRVVLGLDDLEGWQREAYAEVVAFVGQPAVMHVCDRCERVGFGGHWG